MNKNILHLQNKQTNSESGRSMVEMLGVLAIIGVISVGGITSYTYAISKYRASTIFYSVSEMAVVASSQLLSGNVMDLDAYGIQIDELYPFYYEGNYSGTETDFSINVTKIPADVCEHIKNTEYKMPYLQLINDTADGSCSKDMNTVEFIFWDTLEKKCAGGYTGDNCNEKIVCKNGTWTSQGCECNEGWFGKNCDSDCDGWKTTTGVCYTCNSTTTLVSTEEECARCPERMMYYGFNNQARCILKECPPENPIRSNLGMCYSCTASGSYGYVEVDRCQSCKDSGVPRFSIINSGGVPVCHRCDHESPVGGPTISVFCDMCDGTANPRFMGTDGKCYSCELTSFTNTVKVVVDSEAECTVCGNLRRYNAETSECIRN